MGWKLSPVDFFSEIFGGDLGAAYLGTQGDIWDAHRDMALASAGESKDSFSKSAEYKLQHTSEKAGTILTAETLSTHRVAKLDVCVIRSVPICTR